jgi:glutathione S-transferase
MKLRLHTRYQNSAGERVRIVLNLKGVDYEYVSIPSLNDDAYRALNPQGLMPTLEIDGRVVSQSMAIMELLEELFPHPSIFPDDAVLKAQARAFAFVIAAELHPVVVGRVRRYLDDPVGAQAAQVDAWFVHGWARLLPPWRRSCPAARRSYYFALATNRVLPRLAWCRKWPMPGGPIVISPPTPKLSPSMGPAGTWIPSFGPRRRRSGISRTPDGNTHEF